MSRGKNIAIGTIVGIVLGLLYYWLVWDVLFYQFFSFETIAGNWYLPLFTTALSIGFGINFGLQFGFDNDEYGQNLLYLLIAAVYITILAVLLLLAIWVLTNPFARFF